MKTAIIGGSGLNKFPEINMIDEIKYGINEIQNIITSFLLLFILLIKKVYIKKNI